MRADLSSLLYRQLVFYMILLAVQCTNWTKASLVVANLIETCIFLLDVVVVMVVADSIWCNLTCFVDWKACFIVVTFQRFLSYEVEQCRIVKFADRESAVTWFWLVFCSVVYFHHQSLLKPIIVFPSHQLSNLMCCRNLSANITVISYKMYMLIHCFI